MSGSYRDSLLISYFCSILCLGIGVRDRGQGTAISPPSPAKLQKTMEILANARKNQENSGRLIREEVKFRLFHYNLP